MNIVTQSFKDFLCVMASTDHIQLNVFIVLHLYLSDRRIHFYKQGNRCWSTGDGRKLTGRFFRKVVGDKKAMKVKQYSQEIIF